MLSSRSTTFKAFLLSTVLCLYIGLPTSTQASKTDNTTQIKPNHYSPHQIGQALNWIESQADHNLCNGHFEISANIAQHPHPLPMQQQTTSTNSKGPALLKKGGISILNRDVITTQPGRWSKADQAVIYRHGKTGKIRYIHLKGHVSLEEPNQRIAARQGNLDYDRNTQEFYSVLYRKYNTIKKKYYYSWGKAQHYFRDAAYNAIMSNATYTTCNPIHPSWHVHASTLTINHQKHEGIAYNAIIYLHSIPIFYSPYFEFATAPIRKTGFLYPSISNNSKYGTTLSLPFYWNIAPNYDDTFTPTYYSKSGLMLYNNFRFLTSHNRGHFNSNMIFNDKTFNTFKSHQIHSDYPSSDAQYIKVLKSSGPTRGFFNFVDNASFNSALNANINLNYATDPYFLSDFSAPTTTASATNTLQAQQLLNEAQINYNGQHWQSAASLSGYQTLHQINAHASSQYQHLPELDALGIYDHILGNNSFNLNMQYTNFAYHSLFAPFTLDKAIGQRLHLQPQLTHNFFNAIGYIKPSVLLDAVDYKAQLAAPTGQTLRPKFNQSRSTPITSIDTGSYLLRQFHFAQQDYIQTLEPRVMYTYIPYKDQSQFPLFDTSILPFSYNQVFSYNAFSGPDRIQNTNQLSLGLTSRLLTAKDDSNILTANLGIIQYFTPRRVCLTQCDADNSSTSPLAGQLTANLTTHWSVTGSAAWDLAQHNLNNATITTRYNGGQNHVLSLGLNYVHALPGSHIDTNLISAGIAWPIGLHLTTLGYLYYDETNQRPLTALVGLQYDSCCWTLQASYTQQYLNSTAISSSKNTTTPYEHSISVQFMLKGLSQIGDNSVNATISTGIPGYANPFLQP